MEDLCKDFKVLNRHEGLKGSIRDLFSRDYKTISAVKDVTVTVNKGEIVGYLGPNGAGKSTTIKMMTGVLEPTSGKILVNGLVPYKDRTKNCENIGVVFGQRSQLWWSLPLIESFKLLRDLYMVPQKDYEEMIELYRSLVDIEPVLHKTVRQMSLGQRTLSDILAAFLHNPGIVFLDEPTIGLDVSMKSKIQIYDNDIEHLKSYFGSYRTLRVRLDNKDEWEETLIDEKTTDVMTVITEYQKSHKVKDIQLQEISTEEVIKKLYEGGTK